MIRVIVVEDHAKMRQQAADILNRDPGIQVVGTSGTGPELWPVLAANTADVLWLGISRLELDVPKLVQDLRDRYPATKIVIHETMSASAYLEPLLELKLEGYLLKTDEIDIYYPAIHQVYAGHTYISEEFAASAQENWAGMALSPRELEVLALLARDVPEDEIAARMYITTHTVAWHIERIHRKIDVGNTAAAVAKARELGLVG